MTTRSNGGRRFRPVAETAEPELAEIAERIRARVKTIREGVIETGKDLILARGRLGHGEWLPWLEHEFGWSERTAYNFISLAEAEADGKLAPVANLELPLKALYLLAAPSTPIEAVAERAAQGQSLSLKVVEEEVKAAVVTYTRQPAPRVTRVAHVSYVTEEKQAEAHRLGQAAKLIDAVHPVPDREGEVISPITNDAVARLVERLELAVKQLIDVLEAYGSGDPKQRRAFVKAVSMWRDTLPTDTAERNRRAKNVRRAIKAIGDGLSGWGR